MRSLLVPRIALLAALSAVAPACLAGPVFHLVDLGADNSASGINARSHVIGTKKGTVAVLVGATWRAVPGATAGAALNDADQVAGTLVDATTALETAGTWSRRIGKVEIAPFGAGASHAYAVSGNGTVVGTGILDPTFGSIYSFMAKDGTVPADS